MSTYLYHLACASGFLCHIPLCLHLRLGDSWFRASRWLGPLIWSYRVVAPVRLPLPGFPELARAFVEWVVFALLS